MSTEAVLGGTKGTFKSDLRKSKPLGIMSLKLSTGGVLGVGLL